jgi:hypothetical protein
MARPTYLLEVAFTSSPAASVASQVWTDVTQYLDVQAGVKITRGKTDELGDVQPSTLSVVLKNSDGRFTPNRSSSPYYPNVQAGKYIRLSVVWLGTTYRRFTGKIVEWPLFWGGGGAFYAESRVSAVDALAQLSSGDRQFQDLIIEDILDDDPIACYPLGEPQFSLSAGDISGNDAPAIFGTQTGVGGAIDFGADFVEATATTAAVDRVPTFYRSRATAVAFTPASGGLSATSTRYLSAQLRAPVVSATGATVITYARESTTPPSSGAVASLQAADGSWLGVDKNGSGNITARFFDARTGVINEVSSGIGLGTDAPDQYAAVLDIPSAGNGRVTFYWNGQVVGTPVTFAMASVPQWTIVNVGGRPHATFRGDVSFTSFYNYPVPIGAIFAQKQSAFFGEDGTGDTSTSRIIKLTGFLGPPLPTVGGSGPQSCGPQEVAGAPLDAIHLVEATEDGIFFFDGAGAPAFRLRNWRINRAADATVAADMIDPGSVQFRGDNYGLTNDVTASRSDGATQRVVNAASVAAHDTVKASITALSTTDAQLRILAAWQANVDGQQRNRITGIRVSLLNFPSIIPSMLGLDVWKKLRLTGIPTAQAPASSLDLIVEGWSEVISEDDWSMTLTTSPGERVDVWQIGVAGHSEIGTTTTIGY